MPKEKSSIIAEINYADLKMKDNMMASVRKELSPNDTASPTTVTANKTDSNKCAAMADAHLSRSTAASAPNKNNTSPPHGAIPNNHNSSSPLSMAAKTAAATATHKDSNKTSSSSSSSAKTPISDPSKSRTPHDFRFGKSIGEGSFSTVYLAKDIHTHKEYASK